MLPLKPQRIQPENIKDIIRHLDDQSTPVATLEHSVWGIWGYASSQMYPHEYLRDFSPLETSELRKTLQALLDEDHSNIAWPRLIISLSYLVLPSQVSCFRSQQAKSRGPRLHVAVG